MVGENRAGRKAHKRGHEPGLSIKQQVLYLAPIETSFLPFHIGRTHDVRMCPRFILAFRDGVHRVTSWNNAASMPRARQCGRGPIRVSASRIDHWKASPVSTLCCSPYGGSPQQPRSSSMTHDPRLQAAISHWAPRFVANGVALADFEDVTRSITSYDDWCRAWSERASIHEQIGRDAVTRRNFLTAGEALQRAGVYYHFAAFLFVNDIVQMKTAHMNAVACRQAALRHLQPPGERVEIPYGGKTLAGILRKPPATD